MKNSTKTKLLLGGSIALLLVSYRLAIRNTLELRTEVGRLEALGISSDKLPDRLNLLRSKEIYYDSVLRESQSGSVSAQNNLLRALTAEGEENGVRILKFHPAHEYSDELQNVHTYSFEIQGGFISILKTLHSLETEVAYGQVVHVALDKKEDYRTGRNRLEARVFIQKLK